MEIIGISGCKSGKGRTELGLMLLENLRRKTGVLKGLISEGTSELVTEDHQIMRAEAPGISPYLESAAEDVVLLRSSPEDLKKTLDKAMSFFADLDYILVESDKLINFLKPGLIIYVDEGEDKSDSSQQVKEDSDLIINYVELHESSRLRDLNLQIPGEEISCYSAQLISDLLGWGYGEFGKMLDRNNVRVRRCQLGLFE